MTITVKDSKLVWEATDKKVRIWDIETEEGLTYQTKSSAIAAGIGKTYDIEIYEKNGRSYIKQITKQPDLPTAPNQEVPGTLQRPSNDDPGRQSSIEWQSAIKAATEAVWYYYQLVGIQQTDEAPYTLVNFKRDIIDTAITFAAVVDKKPGKIMEGKELDK